MKTNTARAVFRATGLGGLSSIHYDKAATDGGEGSQPDLTPITKSIEEIGKKVENVLTKAELEPLTKEIAGIKQSIKEIRAGEIKTYENVYDDPNRGFKSAGEFYSAVFKSGGNIYNPSDEKLRVLVKAPTGASALEGPSLGYIIPPAFSTMIWDGLNKEPDALVPRTDSYTVPGESLEFPANAETSRATGSRWGGVRGYWIAEADNIASSKPKLRKLKLEPQQLGVLVYLTDKLITRSPIALEQYVSRAAVSEIDFMSSDAIINGTGAGQPQGILNSPCVVSIAKETGQAAATIVSANIDKMWARLHPRSRSKAVWFHNVDVQPQLDNLVQEVGVGGVPLYRPAGGLADSPLATIKGRPAIPIEYCATLGTVGDLILADLSGYATGVYGDGIQTAMSIHVQFVNAETAFRFIYAIDGQPWLASALTPYKGTATLSTFITLATRS